MLSETQPYWAQVDLTRVPNIVVTPPGPESNAWHKRCTRCFQGLSGQVKLFPVVFESGHGCVLRDADGNEYIEFYEEYLDKATAGQVAGFVLEPIQGWGGSVMPPDDFCPKLRNLCDRRGILLMIDEAIGQTEKELGDAAG